jgi:RNA polymerase-binding transcription factor DksA
VIRFAPDPAPGPPADCDHLDGAQLEELRRRLLRLLGAETARSTRLGAHAARSGRRDLIEMRQALRDALAKLDGRLYGRCEICRGPMSFGQLQLVPYARCCTGCLCDEV